MKRAFLFAVFILLVIIPNINAIGKVYTINFDNDINQQIITLEEKDRADIDLVNGTHTIIISKVVYLGNTSKNRLELDIYRYINYKPEDRPIIGYITIHQGEQIKLDFDQDKYNDLSLRIINIKNNETTLLFTKMHECIFSDPKTCEKKEIIKKDESFFSSMLNKIKLNKMGLIIFFSIIIIGLLIFFVFRKIKY